MTFPRNSRVIPEAIPQTIPDDSVSVEPAAAGGLAGITTPAISGDPQDDDAAYLDGMLDETAGVDVRTIPPLVTGDEMAHVEPYALPPISEMQTRRWVLDNTNPVPLQLFPADPWRTELFIKVEGTVAQPLIIASSKADAARQGNNAALWNSTDPFYSVTHTGEVWIHSSGFSASTGVSAWAVTAAPKEKK